MADSPSLQPYLAEILETCYQKAVKEAVVETGLPGETFPKTCPYSLPEILDLDFWV